MNIGYHLPRELSFLLNRNRHFRAFLRGILHSTRSGNNSVIKEANQVLLEDS